MFSKKSFSYTFSKKSLIFWKWKPPKNPLFQETELSYILGKVYSEPQHIQNHSIFRTMTYLNPKVYSDLCETSMMERFAKIVTQRTFWPQTSQSFLKNFLLFWETEVEFSSLIFLLYFRKELTKFQKQTKILLRRNFLSLYSSKAQRNSL